MRFREFLREYTRQQTTQNWGQKLVTSAKRDTTIPAEFRRQGQDEELIDMVLSQLESADPTKNKEYTQGLAKLYANGGLKMEDAASTLSDYLAKFHKLKVKKMIPSPRNDFMRYQNIADFYGVVDEYPDPDENAREVNKGRVIEYYNDDQVRIVLPQDEAAACYYGQGTRWCTAAKNNNMFDTYAGRGSLYIIIPKHPKHKGEKYQLHFEENQYMDENDNPVTIEAIVQRFPSLKNALAEEGRAFSILCLMSDEAKAKISKQGDLYIQSHGKDQGDGIMTINLNAEDPYNFQLVTSVAIKVGAAVDQDLNAPRNDEETLYSGFVVVDTRNNEVYVVHSTINYDGAVDVAVGTTFTTDITKNAANPRTEQVINNLSADLESFLEAQGNGDEDLEEKFAQLITNYGRGIE